MNNSSKIIGLINFKKEEKTLFVSFVADVKGSATMQTTLYCITVLYFVANSYITYNQVKLDKCKHGQVTFVRPIQISK